MTPACSPQDSIAARSRRVLAIIVTYLPEKDRLPALVNALVGQVDSILVVDNTPAIDDRTWDMLKDQAGRTEDLRVVRLGDNLGIAAAINVGIDAALNEGFDYVLLSDQDSRPPVAMVRTLKAVHADLTLQGKKVGCVAPEYYDHTTNQSFPFQIQEHGRFFYSSSLGTAATPWIEIITTITSGSLISRDALIEVGAMREDFFIDHVDTEWCHRARSHGFRIFGTTQTRLDHRLGDEVFSIWWLGWRSYSSYSPLRLYYRFRNFILLCRLDHVPLRWKIRASWYWLGNLYAHGVFCRSRLKNLAMIARGLVDGLRGHSGRYR